MCCEINLSSAPAKKRSVILPQAAMISTCLDKRQLTRIQQGWRLEVENERSWYMESHTEWDLNGANTQTSGAEAYGKVFEAKCNVKKAAATWWTQICSRTTCIAHDFSCSQASIMYHVQFGVSNILVPVKDTAYRSASLIESVSIENSFKTEICDTSQIFCFRFN